MQTGALLGALTVAAPAAAATKAGPLLRISLEGRHETELEGGAQAGSMILQPSAGFWVDSPTLRSDARYSTDLRGFPGAATPYVAEPNHRLEARQDVATSARSGLSLHQHAELVGDPTSLSRLGVTRSYGRTFWLQLDGSYHHLLSRRDAAYVGYEGNASFFTDPALQDGVTHAPHLWLRRQFNQRDGAGIRARVQFVDDLDAPGATSYEPGLTYERRLTEILRLELQAGPAFVTSAGEPARVLPHGKAGLRADTPHSVFTAAYERTFLGSTGLPGAVWADVVTSYYTHRFDTEWSARIGAGVFRNGAAPDGPRAVTGAMTSASLDWRFAPQLTTALSWRLALQDEAAGMAGTVPPIYRNIFALGVAWDMDAGRFPR